MDEQIIIEVLTDARALLRVRGAWTQHHNARDSSGIPTDPTDPNACKFCALGAMQRAFGLTDEAPFVTAKPITDILTLALPRRAISIPEWNDQPSRTRRDVVNLYTRALEIAAQRSPKPAPP